MASDVIQILHYKLTRRRVFKMAPIHHHFELSGWAEQRVVTIFWIAGVVFAVIGILVVGP